MKISNQWLNLLSTHSLLSHVKRIDSLLSPNKRMHSLLSPAKRMHSLLFCVAVKYSVIPLPFFSHGHFSKHFFLKKVLWVVCSSIWNFLVIFVLNYLYLVISEISQCLYSLIHLSGLDLLWSTTISLPLLYRHRLFLIYLFFLKVCPFK